MIRIIIAFTFLIVFLILSIPILIVEWIIGLFSPQIKAKSSLAIVNWAFSVILFMAGATTTVIGEENVPKDEAVLYILNHRSYFDILLTYVRVPRQTGYVAKKEMLYFFTLTWWMKNLHCEFMDRKDMRKGLETIKNCIKKIQNGISIAIFPEGTRNKTEEPLLEFHKGSFKIAEKANCKIVPVVLLNTSKIFEDQFPCLKKQHVIIEYLPPINVAELDKAQRRELPDVVAEQIRTTYIKNKALYEEQNAKKKS